MGQVNSIIHKCCGTRTQPPQDSPPVVSDKVPIKNDQAAAIEDAPKLEHDDSEPTIWDTTGDVKVPITRISKIFSSVVPPSMPPLSDSESDNGDEPRKEEELYIFFPDNYDNIGLTLAEREQLAKAQATAAQDQNKLVAVAYNKSKDEIDKLTPRSRRSSRVGIVVIDKNEASPQKASRNGF
mmetsp:Transcript_20333/g.40275  ORF Transcript_20333/g.40275 Transcript_20333/m.40275 type:complete len:182 (-) Transcript_20333:178-723(-)